MNRRLHTLAVVTMRPFILSLLLLTLLFALGGAAMASGIVFDGSTQVDNFTLNTNTRVYTSTADKTIMAENVVVNSGVTIKMGTRAFTMLGGTLNVMGDLGDSASSGTLNIYGFCVVTIQGGSIKMGDIVVGYGHIVNMPTGSFDCTTLKLGNDSYVLNVDPENATGTTNYSALDPTTCKTVSLVRTNAGGSDEVFCSLIAYETCNLAGLVPSELGVADGVTWYTDAMRAVNQVTTLTDITSGSILYAKEVVPDLTVTIMKDNTPLADQSADTIALTDTPVYSYNETDFSEWSHEWYSGDETIVTIDSNTGAVTPLSVGDTTITLTLRHATNPQIDTTFNLSVISGATPQISKDGVLLTDQAADTITLYDEPTYSYDEDQFDGYNAAWTIEGNVAVINSDTGDVIPLKGGTANITLTLDNGAGTIVKTFALTVDKAQPVISGSELREHRKGASGYVEFPISKSGTFIKQGASECTLSVYTYVDNVKTEFFNEPETNDDRTFIRVEPNDLTNAVPETTYTVYVSVTGNEYNKEIAETAIGQLKILAGYSATHQLFFTRPDPASILEIVRTSDTVQISGTPYSYRMLYNDSNIDLSVDADGTFLQCSSSNADVASVEGGDDGSGQRTPAAKVTAKKPGTTTIDVSYEKDDALYTGSFQLTVTKRKPALTKTSPVDDVILTGTFGQFPETMGTTHIVPSVLDGESHLNVSEEKPYKVSLVARDEAGADLVIDQTSFTRIPTSAYWAYNARNWATELNKLSAGVYGLYLVGEENEDYAGCESTVVGSVTVSEPVEEPEPNQPEPTGANPTDPITVQGGGTVSGDIGFTNVVGDGLLARVFMKDGNGNIVLEAANLPVVPVGDQPRGAGRSATVHYEFPADKISNLAAGTYTLWVDSAGNADNLAVPAAQIGVLVIEKAPDPVIGSASVPGKFKATAGFSYQLITLTDGDIMPTFQKLSTSNKKIATIGADGVLTAKKTGKVTITTKLNGKTKKCTVTVVKNQYGWKKCVVGKKGTITLSTGRLEYMPGRLHLDVWVSNRTKKCLKNIAGLKYEVYDREGNVLISVPFELMRKVPAGKNVYQCLNVTEEMLPGIADKVFDLACGGLRTRIIGWEDAVYTGKALFEGDASDMYPVLGEGSEPEAAPAAAEQQVPTEPDTALEPATSETPSQIVVPVIKPIEGNP